MRLNEQTGPLVAGDRQRLTLYLDDEVVDRAEMILSRSGQESLPSYCERLLVEAIAERFEAFLKEEEGRRQQLLEGLDDITDEMAVVYEWDPDPSEDLGPFEESRDRVPDRTGAAQGSVPSPNVRPDEVLVLESDRGEAEPKPPEEPLARYRPDQLDEAAQTILRHAGLLPTDRPAFLPALRRGEPIATETSQELIATLVALEARWRGAPTIERRVAYAVYRLAFEGQVLITDAWLNAAVEQGTVDLLRTIQQYSDRILSGVLGAEPSADSPSADRPPEPGHEDDQGSNSDPEGSEPIDVEVHDAEDDPR